ncbi:MAG TPA: tetratricopeptide repeat protein [Nitrospirota bacterium]|nr:tetratricopeptide repeat protein [Nitrospirota bacterium]
MKRPTINSQDASYTLIIVMTSILIIGLLSTLSFIRNGIYLNHVTLWADIVKRSPDKRRAHENFGQALSTAAASTSIPAERQRYLIDALHEFQTVMALKDDGSVPERDLYREIGVVYYRLERYNDAIASWERGLRDSPGDASLLNNLSVVMLQQKRFDEAAKYARMALSVAPYMPQALNTMGQFFMAKRNYEQASQYFLKALDQEPDVPQRYWNVAVALEHNGKYESALQYARRYAVMATDPTARQRAQELMEHLRKVSGK